MVTEAVIEPKLSFCVLWKKQSHIDLKRHEGEKIPSSDCIWLCNGFPVGINYPLGF